MRRKPVIWLAATGAVLLAVLLGVRAWILRDNTAPVSVDRVVTSFKHDQQTVAAPTLPPGAHVPAAGVYAYATTGSESATLLGTSRHEYPAETTISVVPGGCGFTWTWQSLDKRSEAWTECVGKDTLTPTKFGDVHAFFGRTDERSYTCTGGPIELSKGSSATITCAKEGTTRTDRVRVLGDQEIEVGGEQVATIHLRAQRRMTGATRGTGTTDTWLARDTSLPIRLAVANDNETDTPLGKPVHYVERYELRLSSLQPRG